MAAPRARAGSIRAETTAEAGAIAREEDLKSSWDEMKLVESGDEYPKPNERDSSHIYI